jgi:hypothetical protein
MTTSPSFVVETQTFRFSASNPVDLDDAVTLAGGSRSGDYVVISHEKPRATYVVEPNGTILVHGLARAEVAELAVQELLLTLGQTIDGLSMESGEMLVSFSLGRAVFEEIATRRFEDISKDERIGALRIEAILHRATLILYNNGRGVVIGQSSKRIAEMAVRHWAAQLDEEGALA